MFKCYEANKGKEDKNNSSGADGLQSLLSFIIDKVNVCSSIQFDEGKSKQAKTVIGSSKLEIGIAINASLTMWTCRAEPECSAFNIYTQRNI